VAVEVKLNNDNGNCIVWGSSWAAVAVVVVAVVAMNFDDPCAKSNFGRIRLHQD